MSSAPLTAVAAFGLLTAGLFLSFGLGRDLSRRVGWGLSLHIFPVNRDSVNLQAPVVKGLHAAVEVLQRHTH